MLDIRKVAKALRYVLDNQWEDLKKGVQEDYTLVDDVPIVDTWVMLSNEEFEDIRLNLYNEIDCNTIRVVCYIAEDGLVDFNKYVFKDIPLQEFLCEK